MDKNKKDSLLNNYMPVSEYSKLKGVTEEQVIEQIREGELVGQIQNEVWYVLREAEHSTNEKDQGGEDKKDGPGSDVVILIVAMICLGVTIYDWKGGLFYIVTALLLLSLIIGALQGLFGKE
jgi:hypothetical protein